MTERIKLRIKPDFQIEYIPVIDEKVVVTIFASGDDRAIAELWNWLNKGKSRRRKGREERLKDLPDNTAEGAGPRQGKFRKHRVKRGQAHDF